MQQKVVRSVSQEGGRFSHTQLTNTSMNTQSFSRNPSFTGPARLNLLLRTVALVLLAMVGIHSSHAATRIWTGGHASSANWNLRDNWGGVAVPANGDTVVFPSGAPRLDARGRL